MFVRPHPTRSPPRPRGTRLLWLALACALPAAAGVQPLLRSAAGHPATPVTLHGHGEFLFVVDTGASRSAIHEPLRARLGLVAEPGPPTAVYGATGAQWAGRYRLPPLSLAGVRPRALLAVGLPAGVSHGDDVMGIVGRDLLEAYVVEFDLRGGRLGLHRPGTLPRSAHGWTRLPIRRLPELGLVSLQIRLNATPVTAVLDTGASRSIVNARAARGAGLAAERLPHGGSAGGASGHRLGYAVGDFRSLAIGSERIARPRLAVADLPAFAALGLNDAPGMILGLDLLGDRRFVVDYPGHRLWIERTPRRARGGGATGGSGRDQKP